MTSSIEHPPSGIDADLVMGIAEILRQQIISGELSPGSRIYEAKLARSLGTSRGPIREASRFLQREGLLRSQANRGFVVRELTIRELIEITDFRTCIESYGIRLATRSPRLEQLLAALKKELKEFRSRCQQGDRIGQVAADFQFHRLIMESSGNRRLLASFDQIATELRIAMRLMGLATEDWKMLVGSHAELIDALATRDPDMAEAAIRRHIHLGWDETLEKLRVEMDMPLTPRRSGKSRC
jgi:DNA-binding GntR family transcriptional regulator